MNHKVLLTGSSGFIGRSLTVDLKKKIFVFAILNNNKKNKKLAKYLKKLQKL